MFSDLYCCWNTEVYTEILNIFRTYQNWIFVWGCPHIHFTLWSISFIWSVKPPETLSSFCRSRTSAHHRTGQPRLRLLASDVSHCQQKLSPLSQKSLPMQLVSMNGNDLIRFGVLFCKFVLLHNQNSPDWWDYFLFRKVFGSVWGTYDIHGRFDRVYNAVTIHQFSVKYNIKRSKLNSLA